MIYNKSLLTDSAYANLHDKLSKDTLMSHLDSPLSSSKNRPTFFDFLKNEESILTKILNIFHKS